MSASNQFVGDIKRLMPPLEEAQEQEETGKELLNLYKKFHFGEDLAAVEVLLENQYLNKKMEKAEMHLLSPHPSTLCTITNKNMKRLSALRNFHDRNLEYFDDFHPVLEVF